MNKEALKQYLLELGNQPSTWRGVILIMTVAGRVLSPEQAELITTLGLASVGMVGAAFKDKK